MNKSDINAHINKIFHFDKTSVFAWIKNKLSTLFKEIWSLLYHKKISDYYTNYVLKKILGI